MMLGDVKFVRVTSLAVTGCFLGRRDEVMERMVGVHHLSQMEGDEHMVVSCDGLQIDFC